jgi:hypothetical protein
LVFICHAHQKEELRPLTVYNYHRLNDVTKNFVPLPSVASILDTLSGAKWSSTLDFKSGCCQCALHPSEKEKSAFCNGQELWKLTVMLFGLLKAGNFQRFRGANLKRNAKKCQLFQKEVRYLHISYHRKELPWTQKLKAQQEWPPPKDIQELRSFIG